MGKRRKKTCPKLSSKQFLCFVFLGLVKIHTGEGGRRRMDDEEKEGMNPGTQNNKQGV
jgi:hypothetical protein